MSVDGSLSGFLDVVSGVPQGVYLALDIHPLYR